MKNLMTADSPEMVRRNPVRAVTEIVGLQLAAAVWLYAFLKVEDWPLLTALFAIPVVLFVLTNRNPGLERRIVQSFKAFPRTAMLGLVIVVVLFPVAVGEDTYVLHLLIIGLLYSVLALALNFQLGSANIPNFATGASYGIGAYVSALLAIHFGINFWYGLIAAAAVATFFGFVLGVPCMRTRESYLALVTIAFGIIIHQLLNNFEWTGGANGLAWNALRNDELAARCSGINVTRYKVLAFMVDAFLSAFAGTVYAFYVSYISPDNFTFLVSVTIMTMVIVGGMDNIFGVVAGTLLLTILPEKFRMFSDYRLLLYGTIVIGMLIMRPQGLFPKQLRKHGG